MKVWRAVTRQGRKIPPGNGGLQKLESNWLRDPFSSGLHFALEQAFTLPLHKQSAEFP